MKASSAREIAVKVLNKYKFSASDAGETLNQFINKTDNRGFCKDITLGTIRNKTAIDNIIEKIGNIETKRIDKRIVNILRIAIYELIYSSSPAEHAIINEAVNIAHKTSNKKSANFINAVLRNIQRNIDRQNITSIEKYTSDLPVSMDNYCRFKTDILPDPKSNPEEYLSVAFSIPKWLITGWLKEYGFDKTLQICLASNRRPGMYLHANMQKIDIESLSRLLSENDIENQITPAGNALKIKSGRPIEKLPGFTDGLFMVQDLTAAKVVDNLELAEKGCIIDLCSAPGGKTAKLAMRFPDAKIIATDTNPARLKMVAEMKQRMKLENIEIIESMEIEDYVEKSKRLNAVLIDVPCSNTGVMAKRVEVRHRLTPKSLKELHVLQYDILKRAVALNPDYLIYSTCSIEQSENQDMVKKFCSEFKTYKLINEELTLPCSENFDNDGGYFAILQNQS